MIVGILGAAFFAAIFLSVNGALMVLIGAMGHIFGNETLQQISFWQSFIVMIFLMLLGAILGRR